MLPFYRVSGERCKGAVALSTSLNNMGIVAISVVFNVIIVLIFLCSLIRKLYGVWVGREESVEESIDDNTK
jgi:putative Mn2+ efflux pump MntP